jgi:thiamine-monophosphate kinase
MSRTKWEEFDIIEQIKRRCHTSSVVRVGIGDDCAMLELPQGERLLTTTDMLIEGVHFRRDWTEFLSLGRKSAAVNLSDLAAMGATPHALFLAIGIPADLAEFELDLFFQGFLEVTHANGAVLAGGDTCASMSGLSISVTALGSAPEAQVVQRSGACYGDGVYVTGSLGDSALALLRLTAGRDLPTELLMRHLEPTARVAFGQSLAAAGIPTAMIDVSDGLLSDLNHVLLASQVGANIEVDRIPLSKGLCALGEEMDTLLDCALTGGEDYELLFTAAPDTQEEISVIAKKIDLSVTRIGTVLPRSDELQLTYKGKAFPLPVHTGYKHFSD